MYLEDLLEEGAAGGEDDFVRGETLAVAREGDVHQTFLLPEAFEARRDVAQEAVPLEAYLTRHRARCNAEKATRDVSLRDTMGRLSAVGKSWRKSPRALYRLYR